MPKRVKYDPQKIMFELNKKEKNWDEINNNYGKSKGTIQRWFDNNDYCIEELPKRYLIYKKEKE